MTKFPVLSSILSPEHLGVLIRQQYEVSAQATCKILRTGINHTYLVSDGEKKYVFRVYSYEWRTKNEILEELRLLKTLKENRVPVSYPLPDRCDEYLQTIEAPEGMRHAVLFSYAEGYKIRNLTEAQCRSVGLLMARLHKSTVNQVIGRTQYNTETLVELPYQYAKDHFPETLEEMQFVKAAANYVSSAFQRTPASELRNGIVHLDLWYDNMNIDTASAITVFDFDFCGNGRLLLDMAYFVMQLFHIEPDKQVFELKANSFYQGYQELLWLSKAEKDLLPSAGLAVWLFYLGVQSRRFDDWSNIFLTNNYLKHYIGMVKRWLDYHDIRIQMLTP